MFPNYVRRLSGCISTPGEEEDGGKLLEDYKRGQAHEEKGVLRRALEAAPPGQRRQTSTSSSEEEEEGGSS